MCLNNKSNTNPDIITKSKTETKSLKKKFLKNSL